MIPSINYSIIANALHALKEGNIRHCESLGFTIDEINALDGRNRQNQYGGRHGADEGAEKGNDIGDAND